MTTGTMFKPTSTQKNILPLLNIEVRYILLFGETRSSKTAIFVILIKNGKPPETGGS